MVPAGVPAAGAAVMVPAAGAPAVMVVATVLRATVAIATSS